MKISNFLVLASAIDALEEPIEGCGHYHTQCKAENLDDSLHYKRYDYPLSVNWRMIIDQAFDLNFHTIYARIYQKAIDQVLENPMVPDRTAAKAMVDQKILLDPTFNATMIAQTNVLVMDPEKLGSHGCWCAKGNPNIDRELGGPPTDIVDWTCKYYIERAECLLLPGGECEDYKLKRDSNPEDWRLVAPDGTEYKEYWARVWLGSIGVLIPEEKVYIELNEDPCLRAKAKVAYNAVRYLNQQLQGGNTPEGMQGLYQAKNPFQRNWDGWKPNAKCRSSEPSVPHTKRCVGFTPNIFIHKEEVDA